MALAGIGIGGGRAAFLSDRAQYQLSEQVVAFLICLANDVAERLAILISKLKSFLRIELVSFSNARIATARFAIHLDAARDERLFEKSGRPQCRIVDRKKRRKCMPTNGEFSPNAHLVAR